MRTMQELSIYSQVATAAYAKLLRAGEDNLDLYMDPDVGMSAVQAQHFAATWSVLEQSIPTADGFSAVLLQDRTTHEKVLAIAGTDDWNDWSADALILLNEAASDMDQYASLESFYQQLVSTGKLGVSDQIVVVGHSLGGFLTQAFTALHTGIVSAAYTYNSPGVGSTEGLLRFFGVTDASAAAKITNVRVVDGLSATVNVGVVLGAVEPVRIEADPVNPVNNHRIARLSDALAVQDLYARLQPSLSPSQIGAQFVTSGYGNRRLEDSLDALRAVFIGSASNDANKTPAEDRDRLYINLYGLRNDSGFKSLSGEVQLVQADNAFASLARENQYTALAYRYALTELLPFAVVASSDARNQTLYGAYAQRLTLFDESTGQGELTDQWLTDRAAMLSWVAARNQQEIVGPISGGPGVQSMHYMDVASGVELDLGLLDTLVIKRQTKFGGDAADTLNGKALGDHLYGGAGTDSLSGQGGGDYLEGNSDADSLDGGADNDTLAGGIGADTLIGGTGDDTLLGGADADTYRFSAGSGLDTIVDGSGSDVIEVDGIGILKGTDATKVADTVWQTADKRVNYTLVSIDAARSDLYISFSDRTDVIRIQDWGAAGNGGITLPTAVTPPTVPTTFTGEFAKLNDGTRYTLSPTGYASAGAQADAEDVLNGTAAAEALVGLGGDDGLSSGAGDDLVEGGDDDDLLLGGTGIDTIQGGNGNDFIFGSAMGSVSTPTSMPFTPPAVAAGGVEVARGFSWVAGRAPGQRWNGDTANFLGVAISGADVEPAFLASDGLYYVENTGNVIDAGTGNDYVGAGVAADTVRGGDGDDDIYGMGGADVIYGDAGSDFISGDGRAASGMGVTTQAVQHGSDTLVGGAGRDVLSGQGGNDVLYGGIDDDQLWGDDTDPTDTPVAIHGSDYLDGGDGVDRLEGGGSDDDLFGGTGNDSLWGDNSTSTTLAAASEGADHLDGEDGNDQLAGGGNDDELFGGVGNDFLWGDSAYVRSASAMVSSTVATQGRDYLDGGDGSDQLVGGGNDDTLFGGTSNDVLAGDDDVSRLASTAHGNDHLDGEDGDDKLMGMGGNDTLLGGANNDTLWGDEGDDILDGSEHSDALFGGAGDDTLDGGAGNDYLDSGDGSDLIAGGAGDDHLMGGAGDDSLEGGSGANYMEGGAGDDTYALSLEDMAASSGRFSVIADTSGTNHLHFSVSSAGATVLADGTGSDVIIAIDPEHAVFVRGAISGSVQGIQFSDGMVAMDRLIAETYAPRINTTVTAAGGRLFGGTAADTLTASSAAAGATLSGGRGDDVIAMATPGGATLLFSTGDGVDHVEAGYELGGEPRTGDNVLKLSAGLSPADLQLTKLNANHYSLDIGTAGDAITFAMNDNDVAGKPSRPFDWIEFSDATTLTWQQLLERAIEVQVPVADSVAVSGTSGIDHIVGNAGTHTIDAGTGDDELVSGAGAEVLVGGRGNDRYLLSPGFGLDRIDNSSAIAGENDTIVFGVGFAPSDTVLTRLGDDLLVGFTTSSDALRITGFFTNLSTETVQFADGFSFDRSTVPSYGTSAQGLATVGADVLTLGVGPDYFDALEGNDSIDGSEGNDTLFGGSGSDLLLGGAGSDVLDGGSGADRLAGGDDDDILIGAGADTLEGGTGSDVISGGYYVYAGAGDDVVDSPGGVISLGSGNDTALLRNTGFATTISDAPGAGETKTLRFVDGITPSSITFRRLGSDLWLEWPDNHHLLVKGFSGLPIANQGFRVEFEAVPDVIWSHEELIALANTPTTGDNVIDGTNGNDVIDGFAGNDTLYGHDGDDWLSGGGGSADSLEGGNGNDTLVGGASLSGGAGNDVLTGGETMSGGGGLDTYHVFDHTFSRVSVLGGADGGDVVVIGEGVSPSDVQVVRAGAGRDLYLQLHDALGRAIGNVRLQGQVTSTAAPAPISEVRFDAQPEVIWTASDLLSLFVQGGPRDDNITGVATKSNDMMGSTGNDTLIGGNLDDTLDGGSGNDLLSGGTGADHYLFGHGVGDDRIVDLDGMNANILRLKPGVSADDVQLVRTGQDSGGVMRPNDSLVLVLASSGEQIWVDQFFQPAGAGTLASIEFADASSWTYADIMGRAGTSMSGAADTQTGTADDDLLAVDNRLDLVVEQAGSGNDTVVSSVSYVLPVNVENLELTGLLALGATGNLGINVIKGNAAGNVLDAGGNLGDQLHGGAGDDTYRLLNASAPRYAYPSDFLALTPAIFENAGDGIDTLVTNEYGATLPENVERLVVPTLRYAYGYSYNPAYEKLQFTYVGNSLDNLIDLSSASADFTRISVATVRIDGGAGADTMKGGNGNDTYVVDSVDDVVVETGVYLDGVTQTSPSDGVEASVSFALVSDVENLTLTGTSTISGTGNARANIVNGSTNPSANILAGLGGDDTYLVDLADTVTEAPGSGNDAVVVMSLAGMAPLTLSLESWQNVENLKIGATLGDINLVGSSGANVLTGDYGSNLMDGLDGDDTLRGLDISTVAWDSYFRHYNYPVRIGSDTLDGGSGNDQIVAYSGSPILRGDSGDDRLEVVDAIYAKVDGGGGNDSLYRWNAPTSAVPGVVDLAFGAGAGNDEVVEFGIRSAAEWAINPIIHSSIAIAEETDASTLQLGRDGAALVIRIAGGFDSVRIDDFFESPTSESIGSAMDSIQLADGTVLDRDAIVAGLGQSNLQSASSADDLLIASINGGAISGGDGSDVVAGQVGNDQLEGGAGDDRLFGADGADRLVGGAGDDLLAGAHGSDVYAFSAGWGHDVVDELQSSQARTVWWVAPTDDEAADELFFDSSVDRVDLQAQQLGVDLLLTHRVTGDSVKVLNYFAGTSTAAGQVESIRFQDGTTWAPADVLQFASAITGTAGDDELAATSSGSAVYGLAGNDTLWGDVANDTLDGGTGIDYMAGNAGDDVYVVDEADDAVIEYAFNGVDRIVSSASWTLEPNVENLSLTGTLAINGTGNSINNVLIGNSAANTLNGRAGADTMSGAAGDDKYVVDDIGDVVNENAGEGTDLVRSRVTFTLATNVENLTLTGTSALNGTGNTLANILTGNAAANRLDGDGGADSMTGGAGNDTYVVDEVTDAVTEKPDEGIDTVESGVSWTLGKNFENLILTGASSIKGTGNSSNNVLVGNSAANTLNGRAGADTMAGGAGNDTYVVDNAGDVVTENAGQGIDQIRSSVTFTLAANVEKLTLSGAAAIDGTGNMLANTLRGNAADNVLDGGAGEDRMIGGAGDDVYKVDDATDMVTERLNAGRDRIETSVTLTKLAANVEDLTLLGDAAINGVGNKLDNALTGNSAANSLKGGAGSDRLDGLAGADTLVGGTGNDTYVMGRGHGADRIRENDPTPGNIDVLQFMDGVAADQIWFRRVGKSLEVSIVGTADKATLQGWYSGSRYHVEQFQTSDGRTLLDSKVQDLVSAMASFAPPAMGQTTLPQSYQATLLPVIAADWGS